MLNPEKDPHDYQAKDECLNNYECNEAVLPKDSQVLIVVHYKGGRCRAGVCDIDSLLFSVSDIQVWHIDLLSIIRIQLSLDFDI